MYEGSVPTIRRKADRFVPSVRWCGISLSGHSFVRYTVDKKNGRSRYAALEVALGPPTPSSGQRKMFRMTLPPRSEMLLCCSVYRMSCHELLLLIDADSRAAVSEVAGCVLLPLSERRYCDYRQRCVATVDLGRIYGNVDNDQLLPSSRYGIPPLARSV